GGPRDDARHVQHIPAPPAPEHPARSCPRRLPRTRRTSVLAPRTRRRLGSAVCPVSPRAPAAASTATYMESLIVKWVNNARANRGIAPLRVGTKLTDLAGDRSATLARTTNLIHPSCLSCVFRSYSISFSTCGEAIAWSSYPWGYQAARSIFLGWKGSPSHWSMLMGRSFHRLAVGGSYRSSNPTPWAAAELAGWRRRSAGRARRRRARPYPSGRG